MANAGNLATIGTTEDVSYGFVYSSEKQFECYTVSLSNLQLDPGQGCRKTVAKPALSISGAIEPHYVWSTYLKVYLRVRKLLIKHTLAFA